MEHYLVAVVVTSYITNFSVAPTDFHSGDVVGYYQPSFPRRTIWNINTTGYTSYSNNVNNLSNTIDIMNHNSGS